MLELVTYPAPILKKGCSSVTIVGTEEKKLLQKMVSAMYVHHGVGLAAPQVGINKRMAVVDIGDKNIVKLINPAVIESGGAECMEEGCLSVPKVYLPVRRAQWVRVASLDEQGKEITLEAEGLMARAIQHEIDHLNGRLIIDYVNPIKRFLILRKN